MPARALLVLAVGVMASILPVSADEKKADDPVNKELSALKGEWKITSRIENGKATKQATIKDRIITFEDAKYTIRDGEEIFVKATFKIDPSKDPKWFDLTIIDDDGSKGLSQLGIYKIEGDTITFCIGGSDSRPTDFSSKRNSGRVLTTYKRVKK